MDRTRSDLDQLRDELESLRDRVNKLEHRLEETNLPTVTSDLRAFVERTDPSSHTERALAICYHLEFYGEAEGITSAKLEDCYKECRLPPPKNPSDVLRRTGENGWLMRKSEEGQLTIWGVTANGQNLIENRIEQ
jgi:hypothetical protein